MPYHIRTQRHLLAVRTCVASSSVDAHNPSYTVSLQPLTLGQQHAIQWHARAALLAVV